MQRLNFFTMLTSLFLVDWRDSETSLRQCMDSDSVVHSIPVLDSPMKIRKLEEKLYLLHNLNYLYLN